MPNPGGFGGRVRRVGVRVQIFRPFTKPLPFERVRGYPSPEEGYVTSVFRGVKQLKIYVSDHARALKHSSLKSQNLKGKKTVRTCYNWLFLHSKILIKSEGIAIDMS